MRISKVTTRTGDEGQTSLANGQRVGKASARIAAIGDVDELNSLIGLVRTKPGEASGGPLLEAIQHHLFIMGGDLATPEGASAPSGLRRISESEVAQIEAQLQPINSSLPPLREFILPGGSETGALLHLARSVARRAERSVAALATAEPINPQLLIYLNRLSDLLFVLARQVNRQSGVPETGAQFH